METRITHGKGDCERPNGPAYSTMHASMCTSVRYGLFPSYFVTLRPACPIGVNAAVVAGVATVMLTRPAGHEAKAEARKE